MKKLKLNNLKVIKLTSEEKKDVKVPDTTDWATSRGCVINL
jgi:hypothetical protein